MAKQFDPDAESSSSCTNEEPPPRKKPKLDASKSSTNEAEECMWELRPHHRQSGEHYQGYPSDQDAVDRYPREEWYPPGWNHRSQVWPQVRGQDSGPVDWWRPTVPKVNFYSFGRFATEVSHVIDGNDDDEVKQHLRQKYQIRKPLMYDVNHLGRCQGFAAHLVHAGENLGILKAITRHTFWGDLVDSVRQDLEAEIKRGSITVNIVFTCWYGRQQSVAATYLFGEMLGTQPCRA